MKTEMDVESFQKECLSIHEKLSDVLEKEQPIAEVAMAALMSIFSSMLLAMKVKPELFQASVDECSRAYKEMYDEMKQETDGKEI